MAEAPLPPPGFTVDIPPPPPDFKIDKPPSQPPLTELTGGIVTRGSFEAVGGTGGMIIGAGLGGGAGLPSGPGAIATGIAGGIAGGGLGSAAGSSTFDIINNLMIMFGDFEGDPQSTLQITENAVRSAVGDAEFAMAFASLGPLGNVLRGGRPIIGRILGIGNEQAAALAARAARFNISVSIVDASKRAFVQGAPRVVGVIPLVGVKLRKAAALKGAQIAEAGERIINEIAPLGLLSDLGVDISKAAGKDFKGARAKIGDAWNLFRELAAKASNKEIVPTATVRQFADEAVEGIEAAKIITLEQKQLGGKLSFNDKLDEFVHDLRALPENVSVEQMRGISQDIVKFADEATKSGSASDLRLLGDLKRNVEAAIQNINTSLLPDGEAKVITDALDLANRTTATELVRFETATAKKLGTFDRRIFKPGPFKAGSKEADELARTFTSLNSPGSVRALRNVVGDDIVNRLARQRVEDAFELSFTSPARDSIQRVFDPSALERNLGLARKRGAGLNRETLEELLKTTDVSIRQIEDFIAVSKEVFKVEVGSASSFVARKLVLSAGAAGVTTGAVAALGLAQGLSVSALSFLFIGRMGARFLASPKQLRVFSRLLGDSLPEQQKRILLGRLIKVGFFDAPITIDIPERRPTIEGGTAVPAQITGP